MYHEFGNTGWKTSKIIYGCMGVSGMLGPQEENDSLEALRAAYDAGINFFDTAESYANGYSEQLLGRALGNVRGKIVISTKVSPGNLTPAGIKQACNRSLKNLNTDYIDLYLIHWPSRDLPLAESIGALKELQANGKICFYGVSNFGKADLNRALELGDISANQVAYHLFFRAIEFELLDLCRKNDIPLMCYSPLMQGLLAGKYRSLDDFPDSRARIRLFDSRKRNCAHGEHGAEAEGAEALAKIWETVAETGIPMTELAVGWIKAQPGIGGVLVGTRNAEQSEYLQKLLAVELDRDIIETLTRATSAIKDKLGGNIDMWDHRTR